MKLILTVILLLMTAPSYAYTTYRVYTNLPEPQPTSKGELIYQEMGCVMCHGIQGNGEGFLAEGLNPKPRNFTDYKVMRRVPDSSIYSAIKNGISGTAMPSFDLTSNQIQDVLDYIRSFSADTHLTANLCLTGTQVVDTQRDTTNFRVEVENPEDLIIRKDGTKVHITPNFQKAVRTLSSKKVLRTHIRLIEGEGEDERNISLIAVRLHRCFK